MTRDEFDMGDHRSEGALGRLGVKMPEWGITHTREKHRSGVERVFEDRWGEVYDELLDKAFGDDDSHHVDVAVDTSNGKVVGFGAHYSCGPSKMEDDLHPANIDCHIDGVGEISHLNTLCVDREWERRGIGGALVQKWLGKIIVSPDITHACAVTWLREKHRTSAPLFEQNGFGRVKEVEKYYWTPGWKRTTCPDCEGICTCSGRVYARGVRQP